MNKTKPNTPQSFTESLVFNSFSGTKVILTDIDNIRYWMKKEDFADILKNRFHSVDVDDVNSKGIWFSGTWITEKKGTSYLTRPYEEGAV